MIYQVTWTESSTHTAFVEADSESAARQTWIDNGGLNGELMPGEFVWREGAHLEEVVEMAGPHDGLCCCPICEGSLK